MILWLGRYLVVSGYGPLVRLHFAVYVFKQPIYLTRSCILQDHSGGETKRMEIRPVSPQMVAKTPAKTFICDTCLYKTRAIACLYKTQCGDTSCKSTVVAKTLTVTKRGCTVPIQNGGVTCLYKTRAIACSYKTQCGDTSCKSTSGG